ncbi:MAG: tetratricopeptide repeat protein [Bacteroidetes bacterium]|nr:tetratricopeptide repeat protein [Bacteroidota bacterium]
MNRIISVLAVLLVVSSMLFAQAKEMDPVAAKAYNDGNQAMKTGDFQGAIAKYDEALKTSSDYRIHYQRGVTLKKLRKYDEAEDALNKCVEANPKFAVGFNGLGGTYFSNGKYEEAANAFKKFSELSTKEAHKKQGNEYVARAYTKLGESAKVDGKQQQAIQYFTEAVKYHPFDAAYLLLAEVLVDNAKYTEALDAADKALNNRKTVPRGGPLYYKGKAFLGINEVAKAKEAFEAGKKDKSYRDLCEYELKIIAETL